MLHIYDVDIDLG